MKDFGYKPEASQCDRCKHIIWEAPWDKCKAYPNGIPRKLLVNEVSHREPYKHDGGLRFEETSERKDSPR